MKINNVVIILSISTVLIGSALYALLMHGNYGQRQAKMHPAPLHRRAISGRVNEYLILRASSPSAPHFSVVGMTEGAVHTKLYAFN